LDPVVIGSGLSAFAAVHRRPPVVKINTNTVTSVYVGPSWHWASSLLVLIAFELPVSIAMGLISAIGYAVSAHRRDGLRARTAVDSVSNYGLSVVPLFLMMGVFAARSGLSRDLFAFVNAFVGHMRGGLAIASIGACAGFGAICGSSLATVATITPVALPEMRHFGYDDKLAAGPPSPPAAP
jgi:TRAP-type mannitol/chloroaromatic compound transport system permease large subunit